MEDGRRLVTLDVTADEAELLLLALRDLKQPDGSAAWDHPTVLVFRHKLVNAIQEQILGA